MPFIGNKPSAIPLTSADITDGIITNADIANSTINLTTKVTGSLPVANGGTGLTALGTASQLLRVNSGATALEFATVSGTTFGSALFHIRDEKSANTAGGTGTQGSFVKRTLNTTLTNEISGASISSSVITLPSGTYYIQAYVPAWGVNRHKAKLRNTTDSTDTLIGTSEYTESASQVTTCSLIIGRFTISAQKNFEIQTRIQTTYSTSDFGLPSDMGLTEVFTNVQIWKVA